MFNIYDYLNYISNNKRVNDWLPWMEKAVRRAKDVTCSTEIRQKKVYYINVRQFFVFIFLVFFHTFNVQLLSERSVVTGFFPCPPRFLPSIIYAKRVQLSRNLPAVGSDASAGNSGAYSILQIINVDRKEIHNPLGFELATFRGQGSRLAHLTTG